MSAMRRFPPDERMKPPTVPVEALRPALRRLVWCEVDGGSRWAREVLGEVERADGALLEIVDEERKRLAASRKVSI